MARDELARKHVTIPEVNVESMFANTLPKVDQERLDATMTRLIDTKRLTANRHVNLDRDATIFQALPDFLQAIVHCDPDANGKKILSEREPDGRQDTYDALNGEINDDELLESSFPDTTWLKKFKEKPADEHEVCTSSFIGIFTDSRFRTGWTRSWVCTTYFAMTYVVAFVGHCPVRKARPASGTLVAHQSLSLKNSTGSR